MFRNSAADGVASGKLQRPAVRVVTTLSVNVFDFLDRVVLAVLTCGYSELPGTTTDVRPERESAPQKSTAPFMQRPDR